MPTVPAVSLADHQPANLPAVRSVDASPMARGAESLARGIGDIGRGIGAWAGAIARRDADAAGDAAADWEIERTRKWNGYQGESGGPVRGLKDWDEGDSSVSTAAAEVWNNWKDNPDGPYAKLSPRARKIADRQLYRSTDRFISDAAQRDIAVEQSRRATADRIGMDAAERAALDYAMQPELFESAAADAADRAGRLAAGRLITNPDETDPGKLTFHSENGRALYDAARAQALDKLRHDRALTLISAGKTDPDGASAHALIAAALESGKSLPPAQQAALREHAAAASAYRKSKAEAEARDAARAQREAREAQEAQLDDVMYRHSAGKIDDATAFSEIDALRTRGAPADRATVVLEHARRLSAARADAADKLAAAEGRGFAASGKGDGAEYDRLLNAAATADDPDGTQAALTASLGKIDRAQYNKVWGAIQQRRRALAKDAEDTLTKREKAARDPYAAAGQGDAARFGALLEQAAAGGDPRPAAQAFDRALAEKALTRDQAASVRSALRTGLRKWGATLAGAAGPEEPPTHSDMSTYAELLGRTVSGADPARLLADANDAWATGMLSHADYGYIVKNAGKAVSENRRAAVAGTLAESVGWTPERVAAALKGATKAATADLDRLRGEFKIKRSGDWFRSGVTVPEFLRLANGAEKWLEKNPGKDAAQLRAEYFAPILNPAKAQSLAAERLLGMDAALGDDSDE